MRKKLTLLTGDINTGHQKAILFDLLSQTLINYQILWKERNDEYQILFDLKEITNDKNYQIIISLIDNNTYEIFERIWKKYQISLEFDTFYKQMQIDLKQLSYCAFEILIYLLHWLLKNNFLLDTIKNIFLYFCQIFCLKINKLSQINKLFNYLNKTKKINYEKALEYLKNALIYNFEQI
ncbi:hypothetical protein [Mycoplasma sp. 1018B]|uniref:hypothetical protein n=1 Tax=Mycoplasma sp. 1018B TaxID=2967302 RepID=UPI00211C879C|nr:hypothetical protein [Mycoplasma sp. 1018B]UUM19461.1 hypothetical protein NPA14_01170 [Mycoplasma sp. 1018B]